MPSPPRPPAIRIPRRPCKLRATPAHSHPPPLRKPRRHPCRPPALRRKPAKLWRRLPRNPLHRQPPAGTRLAAPRSPRRPLNRQLRFKARLLPRVRRHQRPAVPQLLLPQLPVLKPLPRECKATVRRLSVANPWPQRLRNPWRRRPPERAVLRVAMDQPPVPQLKVVRLLPRVRLPRYPGRAVPVLRWRLRPPAVGLRQQACKALAPRPYPVGRCPERPRNRWHRRQWGRGGQPGTALTGPLHPSQAVVRHRDRAVQRPWPGPAARTMAVHFHQPAPVRVLRFPECKAAVRGLRGGGVCPVPPLVPWRRRRMVRRARLGTVQRAVVQAKPAVRLKVRAVRLRWQGRAVRAMVVHFRRLVPVRVLRFLGCKAAVHGLRRGGA